MAVPQTHTLFEVAAQLNANPRWLRRKVSELNVPHLQVGRRVAFTDEHLETLIRALEVQSQQPTNRSRQARRKGRAA